MFTCKPCLSPTLILTHHSMKYVLYTVHSNLTCLDASELTHTTSNVYIYIYIRGVKGIYTFRRVWKRNLISDARDPVTDHFIKYCRYKLSHLAIPRLLTILRLIFNVKNIVLTLVIPHGIKGVRYAASNRISHVVKHFLGLRGIHLSI